MLAIVHAHVQKCDQLHVCLPPIMPEIMLA